MQQTMLNKYLNNGKIKTLDQLLQIYTDEENRIQEEFYNDLNDYCKKVCKAEDFNRLTQVELESFYNHVLNFQTESLRKNILNNVAAKPILLDEITLNSEKIISIYRGNKLNKFKQYLKDIKTKPLNNKEFNLTLEQYIFYNNSWLQKPYTLTHIFPALHLDPSPERFEIMSGLNAFSFLKECAEDYKKRLFFNNQQIKIHCFPFIIPSSLFKTFERNSDGELVESFKVKDNYLSTHFKSVGTNTLNSFQYNYIYHFTKAYYKDDKGKRYILLCPRKLFLDCLKALGNLPSKLQLTTNIDNVINSIEDEKTVGSMYDTYDTTVNIVLKQDKFFKNAIDAINSSKSGIKENNTSLFNDDPIAFEKLFKEIIALRRENEMLLPEIINLVTLDKSFVNMKDLQKVNNRKELEPFSPIDEQTVVLKVKK